MPMSFTDPQSITISGSTISLPKVETSGRSGSYESSDGLVRLSAVHNIARRKRHTLRLDHKKISADPFFDDRNVELSMSVYMVFDVPLVGYDNTEAKAVYTGFKGLYTASSDALIDKLLGGES